MNAIPLTRGLVALVDDEDYERVAAFGSWSGARYSRSGLFYASRASSGTTIYMHRFILSASKGEEVDHRNHDGLDNRRSNLRLATKSQNHGNERKTDLPTTSRFKGVSASLKKGWRAQIMVNGLNRHIGYFVSENDAAAAYAEAARAAFGEFANGGTR